MGGELVPGDGWTQRHPPSGLSHHARRVMFDGEYER